MTQRQPQKPVIESALHVFRKQYLAACFQQLSVFNPCRTDWFARAAAETTIDMGLKGDGVFSEFSFFNGAHQIDATTRAVVFISGERVSRAGFKTKSAVYTRKKLVLFGGKRGCELG